MSEFLMVVPPEFIEFDFEATFPGQSIDDFQRWISDGTLYEMTNAFEAAGLLPEAQAVVDARVFRDGDAVRFWVMFGAE